MFCIECGAQIPESAKYCSHCGVKQSIDEASGNEKLVKEILKKEGSDDLKQNKSSIDYDFLKKAMGWYLGWIVFHLAFLLVGSDAVFTDSYRTDAFWPLGDFDIGEYDIREFLVYSIFPVAILVMLSMVKPPPNNEYNDQR